MDGFTELHKEGLTLILRDELGETMMAVSKVEQDVSNPDDIELLAIFGGLQFFAVKGIHNLIIESDNLLLIKELHGTGPSYSMLGSLIAKTRNLQGLFNDCIFQHDHRESNGVAQKLARYAWSVDNIVMWWESFPDFIVQATSLIKICKVFPLMKYILLLKNKK